MKCRMVFLNLTVESHFAFNEVSHLDVGNIQVSLPWWVWVPSQGYSFFGILRFKGLVSLVATLSKILLSWSAAQLPTIVTRSSINLTLAVFPKAIMYVVVYHKEFGRLPLVYFGLILCMQMFWRTMTCMGYYYQRPCHKGGYLPGIELNRATNHYQVKDTITLSLPICRWAWIKYVVLAQMRIGRTHVTHSDLLKSEDDPWCDSYWET